MLRSEEDSTPDEEEYEKDLKEMVGCVSTRTTHPTVCWECVSLSLPVFLCVHSFAE